MKVVADLSLLPPGEWFCEHCGVGYGDYTTLEEAQKAGVSHMRYAHQELDLVTVVLLGARTWQLDGSAKGIVYCFYGCGFPVIDANPFMAHKHMEDHFEVAHREELEMLPKSPTAPQALTTENTEGGNPW